MSKLKFVTLLLSLLITVKVSTLLAQNQYELRYSDHVYVENIRSVQWYNKGLEQMIPIIRLGSADKLNLHFDDLYNSTQNYYFRLILCNADWTPADLLTMEYIDGQEEDFFGYNASSINTVMAYSHYKVTVPSAAMRITKSGNYLLKVYPEGSPDEPILTRRFYVVEPKVAVEASVFTPNAPQYRDQYQEFKIKINLNGYSMPNVLTDLKVSMMQNYAEYTQQWIQNPTSINTEEVVFDKPNHFFFKGSNEFRILDMRSLKASTASIRNIEFGKTGYVVNTLVAKPRFNERYLKYEDLNGGFSFITWDNYNEDDYIEADYATVNFFYELDSIPAEGKVYLLGGFNSFVPEKENLMIYDSKLRLFKNTKLLKQGYYDFRYVYIPDNHDSNQIVDLEGNHFETLNKYQIFIYYREQGLNWDKLVGFESLN